MSAAAAAARRLRIAVFNRRFDPSGGGAERYSVALVAQLAARHDFEVFAQHFAAPADGAPPAFVRRRVPLGGLRPRWLNQLWFAIYTWWHTRRGFDLVHSHEATWHGQVQTVHVRTVRAGLFAGRRGFGLARRWLECALSPRLWLYLGLEAARLRPRAGRVVVAVSRPLQLQLEALYPRLAGRTVRLAPGVDSAAAAAASVPALRAAARSAERTAWGVPPDVPVLLLVANDFEKKGLATLLDCLPLLRCGASLVVVGGAADAEWRRWVAADGLEARVHFAGTRVDPGPAYLAADILVHPTREDTFGMVVLEAMAHGLPVIVSASPFCGIAAELVPERDAVVLERPDDAAALARAIDRVAGDARLREQLIAAGLRYAAAHDWAAVAARQEAIYQQALGR